MHLSEDGRALIRKRRAEAAIGCLLVDTRGSGGGGARPRGGRAGRRKGAVARSGRLQPLVAPSCRERRCGDPQAGQSSRMGSKTRPSRASTRRRWGLQRLIAGAVPAAAPERRRGHGASAASKRFPLAPSSIPSSPLRIERAGREPRMRKASGWVATIAFAVRSPWRRRGSDRP